MLLSLYHISSISVWVGGDFRFAQLHEIYHINIYFEISHFFEAWYLDLDIWISLSFRNWQSCYVDICKLELLNHDFVGCEIFINDFSCKISYIFLWHDDIFNVMFCDDEIGLHIYAALSMQHDKAQPGGRMLLNRLAGVHSV